MSSFIQIYLGKLFQWQNPWKILFQIQGSIWLMVLPYCILNCAALVLVTYLEGRGFHLEFSPKGHALMSLLIAYLVVSKVTLAFHRFMALRAAIGCAFLAIRETYQLAILFTEDEVTEEAKRFRRSVSPIYLATCCCNFFISTNITIQININCSFSMVVLNKVKVSTSWTGTMHH